MFRSPQIEFITKTFVQRVSACRWGVLLVIVFLFSFASAADAPSVQVELSKIGDALHLEFAGAKEWKYDLKKADGSQKVTLRLAGLKSDAAAKLKAYKDGLVEGISINENGVDGTAEVVFTVTSKTDFFDYLTDQPSKLIVDFFPKETSTGKKAALTDGEDDEDDAKGAVVNVPKAKVLPAKKSARNPAGGDFVMVAKNDVPATSSGPEIAHGIFDGGDPQFARFAIKDYEIRPEAIKESRANYYLPFPILDLGTPQLKALIMTPPTYEIVKADGRENSEARIILKLFYENKPALFLKTADEFLHAYPETQYSEIIRYMVADTHYNIWRAEKSYDDFEIAMNIYLKLSEKFPDSPITPRTLLLMGYSYLNRGDSFAALKSFQRFARSSPASKHLDRVNIATASAYLMLNRHDDAFALLDLIEKNGKTQKGREEAAFRKGDVAFCKKDYAEAITQYKGAATRHPAAVSQYPNAVYNTAEAQFNLEKYRDGLGSYGQFVQKFPDHDHGGYAMTRIGELLGILGADPKRAEGAFLESYFRYRATPGAGVARIRMLASRMPSMKEKELVSALAEMNEITKKYENRPVKDDKEAKKKEEEAKKLAEAAAPQEAEKKHEGAGHDEPKKEEGFKVADNPDEDATRKLPELPGIEEFTRLLVADGYTERDEFDVASKGLITYFQQNPHSPNKQRILGRIQRNMTESIHSAIERGDFIEALRRYSKDSGGWLKNSGRLDLPYYVGRAYEQAGVFKEAGLVYAETLKGLQTRKADGELPIRERTPKAEGLNLRLASVAAKEKSFAEAEKQLKLVKEMSKLTEPEQIEYAEVAADVSEARGQSTGAKKYLSELIKTWKGDPRLTASLHLRIARIDAKSKDFKSADSHLEKIMEFQANGDYMPEDVHAQALELQGDLNIARGKRQEGIKSYRALLAGYEAKRPLSSIRYKLGQLLYEDGDLKAAEKVWNELKPERDNIWHRLAAEEMRGAKWQKEYRKYINRIPAAADMRSSADSASKKR